MQGASTTPQQPAAFSVAQVTRATQEPQWWRPQRAKVFLIALLLLAALFPSAYICWQARDGSSLGEFEDDELYLTAAKSLVETGAYKIPSLPGQPYQTKYPPLYPLLLSGVWKLAPSFPGNLKWFVLLDGFLWLGFLAAAFVAFRALQLDPVARWVALVLLASNPACQFLATTFMPEALFSAFVIGAILFAECSNRSPGPNAAAVCSALAAGCAFLTKTAALPLAITIPLVFLLRRQYRRALCFLAVVSPFIAGWAIWSTVQRQHPADPVFLFYVDYLGFYRLNVTGHDLPSLISYNFQYLLGMFRFALPSISDVGGQTPIPAVILIPTAISLIGAVRLLKRTRSLHAAAFCVLYLVQLLVWNFNPRGRFLYPLLPFLAAGLTFEAVFAMDLITKSLQRRRGAVAGYLQPLAFGTIIAISLLASAANAREFGLHGAARLQRNRAHLLTAYRWLDQNVPKDAQLVAYDDGGLYLYTGRQGVRNQIMTRAYVLTDKGGMQRPITTIADFAHRHGFAYVLWSANDYDIDDDAATRLLAMNTGLDVVYQAQGVRIYRVD